MEITITYKAGLVDWVSVRRRGVIMGDFATVAGARTYVSSMGHINPKIVEIRD